MALEGETAPTLEDERQIPRDIWERNAPVEEQNNGNMSKIGAIVTQFSVAIVGILSMMILGIVGFATWASQNSIIEAVRATASR